MKEMGKRRIFKKLRLILKNHDAIWLFHYSLLRLFVQTYVNSNVFKTTEDSNFKGEVAV